MYWRVGCIASPGPLCGRRFIDNCFLTCDMKIAIFGGGHGVCAAARLSDPDHEAQLWRRAAAPPAPAVRAGTFTSAALKDAEPGAIAAPATAWPAIGRAIAPRRAGGQVAPSYSCRRTSGRTGPSLGQQRQARPAQRACRCAPRLRCAQRPKETTEAR